MSCTFTKEPLANSPAEAVFVTLFEKGKLRAADGGTLLDKIFQHAFQQAVTAQSFAGKEGETLVWPTYQKISPKYVILAGLGQEKKFSLETARRLGGKLVQTANRLKVASLGGVLEAASVHGQRREDRLRAFAEGGWLANYQFRRFKTKQEKGEQNTFRDFYFHSPGPVDRLKKVCDEALAIAEGVHLARDLTNLPPNILTPTALGKRALELAKRHRNLWVKVFSPAEIRAQKMGALLAVSQGAQTPPAFIHLRYTPPKKTKTKLALVGKGITFDSGGLNIKTRDQELMKIDMAGAAAILGLFQTIAQLKPSVAVEGFIPAAENMPAGNAYHPSDIITTRSGKTVEIINTDAEGRLALADALDFAAQTKPDWMIDMATLTGGAASAVGELYTPMLGNDRRLIERLLAAGKKAGEPSWELPLVADYKKGYLKGPADLKNSGSGTKASTIAGALFLEEFVGKNKWVHMDIASTAWADEATNYYSFIGATGNPVRTLVYLLMNY